VNNISTLGLPSYAAELFSSTQGENGWRYAYEASSGTWVDMPFYATNDFNGAWEVSEAQYVSAFELAPASCSGDCDTGGVAREWVAPQSGSVDVRGWILKTAAGGTGVYAAIDLVSGEDVTPLWPVYGGRLFLAGNNQGGVATDVSSVAVHAGDRIRFEVFANGDNSYDTVSWTPSVAYVRPQRSRLGGGTRRPSGSPSLPQAANRF